MNKQNHLPTFRPVDTFNMLQMETRLTEKYIHRLINTLWPNLMQKQNKNRLKCRIKEQKISL